MIDRLESSFVLSCQRLELLNLPFQLMPIFGQLEAGVFIEAFSLILHPG